MASRQPSGKRRWVPLRIVKEIDESSPKLSQLMTAAENIPEVDLETYRNEGGRMVPSAKYKLTNAIVSGIQKMGSAGDRPLESIAFTFQKIEITH
jgi:type VI secretion system Hcp family effector